MGMNFSPMYQPVSTKTIKADGDLNIIPYDLLATDVKCDTVEATEFVGGVGNFSSLHVSVTKTNTGFIVGTRSVNTISITHAVNGTITLYDDLPTITTSNKYAYFSMDTAGFVNDIIATLSVSGIGAGSQLWYDVYQNNVLLTTIQGGAGSKNVTIDLTEPIKIVGRSSGSYSGPTVTLTFPTETYYLA